MECNCMASLGIRGRGTVQEKGVMMIKSRQLLMMRDTMLLTIMTMRLMRDGDDSDSDAESFDGTLTGLISMIAEEGTGSHISREVAAAADSSDNATYNVSTAAASAWNILAWNSRNCTDHPARKAYACCRGGGGASCAAVIRKFDPGGEGTMVNMYEKRKRGSIGDMTRERSVGVGRAVAA
jgi:hypothetical protein